MPITDVGFTGIFAQVPMVYSKLSENVSGFSLGIEDLTAEKVDGMLSALKLQRTIRYDHTKGSTDSTFVYSVHIG